MGDCWFCEECVGEEGAVSCSSCYAVFHQDCWLSSIGCPRADCFSISAFQGSSKELRSPRQTEGKSALQHFNIKVAYLPFIERLLTFDDETGWISCQYQWRSSEKPMWTNERWLPDHAIKYLLRNGDKLTVVGRDNRELFTTNETALAEAIALFAECTILSDSHK